MELDWLLAPPLPAAVPRQRVLYLRLREAILCGRLPADTRLPASRSFAATLGIARNTVLFAYEQLVAEGVANRHQYALLPDDAVLELVRQLSGSGRPLRFAARLRQATGGNPFFVNSKFSYLKHSTNTQPLNERC